MFTDYYKTYRDKIYNHFVYRTGDPALAEDLSSATFLKAYEAFERYDDTRGAFSTWIYTIAQNVLTDHYRKSGREIPTDFTEICAPDETDITQETELQFDQALLLQHAYEAFDALPEHGARCMTYRYVDDLSTKEIASLLDLSEVSVRKHISRSITRVKTYLSETYKYRLV